MIVSGVSRAVELNGVAMAVFLVAAIVAVVALRFRHARALCAEQEVVMIIRHVNDNGFIKIGEFFSTAFAGLIKFCRLSSGQRRRIYIYLSLVRI
jgi:hypothetical protein